MRLTRMNAAKDGAGAGHLLKVADAVDASRMATEAIAQSNTRLAQQAANRIPTILNAVRRASLAGQFTVALDVPEGLASNIQTLLASKGFTVSFVNCESKWRFFSREKKLSIKVAWPEKKPVSIIRSTFNPAVRHAKETWAAYTCTTALLQRQSLSSPFGLRIAELGICGSNAGVFISCIVDSSPASQTDLRVNDRLIMINNLNVASSSFDRVVEVFRSLCEYKVQLVVLRLESDGC